MIESLVRLLLESVPETCVCYLPCCRRDRRGCVGMWILSSDVVPRC